MVAENFEDKAIRGHSPAAVGQRKKKLKMIRSRHVDLWEMRHKCTQWRKVKSTQRRKVKCTQSRKVKCTQWRKIKDTVEKSQRKEKHAIDK